MDRRRNVRAEQREDLQGRSQERPRNGKGKAESRRATPRCAVKWQGKEMTGNGFDVLFLESKVLLDVGKEILMQGVIQNHTLQKGDV